MCLKPLWNEGKQWLIRGLEAVETRVKIGLALVDEGKNEKGPRSPFLLSKPIPHGKVER